MRTSKRRQREAFSRAWSDRDPPDPATPDPVSRAPVSHRLPRSRQRGLRGAADELGARFVEPRVRLRRRHLLPRILPVRGAEQPRARARRRAAVDRAHRDRLGPRVDRDAVHHGAAQLLCDAVPARRGRSGILSRHRVVFHLLVSGARSRARDRAVLHRKHGGGHRRRAAVGRTAVAPRRRRSRRLAMAVSGRRHSRRRARSRRAVLPDRSPGGRAVAAGGGKGVADRCDAQRARCAGAAWRELRAHRPVRSDGLAARAEHVPRRHERIRLQLLSPADREGVLRRVGPRGWHVDGDSVSRCRDRDGERRDAFGSHGGAAAARGGVRVACGGRSDGQLALERAGRALRGAVDCGDRPVQLHTSVLVAADGVLARRRRRGGNRIDQRGRKPWRISRTVRHGVDERRDRRLPGGASVPRRGRGRFGHSRDHRSAESLALQRR